MVKPKLVDEVVPTERLLIWPREFQCPYCDRTFERGGGKEGFVKSGAQNHVDACHEALLYLQGYLFGDWTVIKKGRMVRTGPGSSESRGHLAGHVAIPIDPKDPRVKRIKRVLSVRRRDGVDWAIKAKGFTLIELMIVVAIIAILASIILPTITKQACDPQSREVRTARMYRDCLNTKGCTVTADQYMLMQNTESRCPALGPAVSNRQVER